jgi:glycine/D-amino acid oxidase-like deaminating enzyme
MARKEIIVVGAGIIGASIAWHLAKAGARVTVLAESGEGGVATPASFAWINASWGNPEPYFRLRRRGMQEWRRLAAECPDIPLAWTGGLCFDQPRDRLEAFANEHASWGYGIRRVGPAEIARLEPALKNPPELALHVAEEGMVEPALAAQALLADAARHGAVMRAGVTVDAVELSARPTVVTSEGRIEADEIVLAAGIGTPVLAKSAGIDIPLDTPPGLIVHSKPHRRLINGLILAELAVRQTADGRVIGSGEVAGSDPGDDPDGTAERLFAELKSMLVGADDLELDFHTVGNRPLPKDGFPIVGRAAGGLYIAVMHSGITLAPAVGLFAASEILAGERDPLLAPYGLERFSGVGGT